MLSQVERGETSPTLAVAARIAAGLELTLSQLLRLDEGRHVVVIRSGPGRRSRRRRGHQIEELTPPLPGQRADVSMHRSPPARRPAAPATRRCTSRAAARPSSSSPATVALIVDGERHELGAGDSVTFDADLPHHFDNQGDGDGRDPRRHRRRARGAER